MLVFATLSRDFAIGFKTSLKLRKKQHVYLHVSLSRDNTVVLNPQALAREGTHAP